jgi:hypothetical protein
VVLHSRRCWRWTQALSRSSDLASGETRRLSFQELAEMKTETDERIAALLVRKREIDALPKDQFTETYRWLVDGVELLLRSVMELRESLRDNGIIR